MKGRHFSSSPQRERKNASSSSSSSNAPSTSSNKKGFSFVSSPTFQGDNKLGYSSAVRSILIGVPPSNQEIEDFIFSTEEYIERERHTKTMSPEALIVMEDAKRLLKDIRLFIDSKNQNEEFQHLLIKCQRITERLKERLDKERHNLNLGFSDSLKTLEGISSDVSHLGKNLIISGEFRKLLFEGFKTLQLLINLLTDRWIEKHKEPLQKSSSTSFDYYDLNKNDHDDDFNDNDNDFDHHDKNKDKMKERKDRRKQRKIQRQKQNYIKGNPTFDHQLDELTEKTIAILSLMKENPEYHRAVRGIFHLMKNFRAQRQLVQNDFIKSIHDELEDVRNLAIAILNHFVKKPHFVDHLVEKINDWFKFISEDPEISHFIENTESLIHFLLERPETIDHRIVREHIRTAKNLFIKKEQRELHHLSSIIIRDLLRLFEMIRTDEDVIRIAMGIERLIDDFLVKTVNSNQRKFKFDWALLGEIKSLLIPMILENLKEIYIPRMEFSSGNYDFIAEDIHISALSLLPENIHIEWYNGVDLGFRRRNNWGGSKTSSSSSTSSSINQHYADPFFHYSSSSSNHQHPIYQHHQQQHHHQVPISSKNQQPSSSSSSSQNRNYYYQDVDRPEYDHRHNLSFFDPHHPHHPHQQQQQQHYQQSHPHQPYYPHQQQQHIHHSNEPSRWSYDDPRTRSIKENCPPIHPDTANSLLRIRIFHLTTRIENIHFWFRHRTTPVWEDYGIMDLILGGEGLFISIVLQGYSDNKDYTDGPYLPHHRMGEKRSFLGVRNVFVDIDDLVIRFRDTKHDLLYSLITSVLKPMIISRLETIISQKVTELLSGSYNNISNFWHRLKDELSQWIASNILPFDKKSSSTFDPFNKNQFSFSTSSSTSVSSFTGASPKKKNLKQKKQSGKSKKIASKDQYHESDEEQEEKYHEEDRESDRESDSSIDDNDSSDSESEDSSETTTENSSSSGSSSESEDDDENDDGFPQSYTVTPQDTPKMTSKKTPKNLHDDSLNINNDNDNDNDQQRKEREKSYLKRNRYPKTWEAQNLHSQSQSQSHPQPVSVIVTDTSNLLSPKIKTMKSNDRIINDNNNNSNISSFNQETSSSSSILSSSSKNIEKEREKKEERRKNKQQSKHNESNKIQNKDEEFETIKLNETSSSSVNPESSTTSSSSQNEKKDNDENFDFDHHHLETKSFEGSSKDVLSPTTTLLPSMMRSRQRNLKIPRGIDQINEKERSTQRTNTPQVQKQKQQLQPQEEHQHQRQRHNIDNDDDEEQELEAGGSMDEEERIMTKQKVKRPTVSSTHKTNHRFVNSPILSRKSPTTMQRTSPLIRNPVLGNSPSPIRAPSPSVARASSPSVARASSPSLARASSAPSPSPSPSPSPNSSNSSLTSSNPNSSSSSSSSSSMRKGIVLGNFYPSTPPPSPLNFSQEVRAKNFQGSVSPDPFTSFVSE